MDNGFEITAHATQELTRRSISAQLLDEVLQHPEQIVPEYGGCRAYQSKIDFGGGKIYLLRAIVDDRVVPPRVITVYRTSKISKYWRGP